MRLCCVAPDRGTASRGRRQQMDRQQMKWLYTLAMILFDGAVALAGCVVPASCRSKTAAFVQGRRRLLATVARQWHRTEGRRVIWVHAASLGEFAIARPLIEALGRETACDFVITFFSPSGYEPVKASRRYANVFYLPLDTPRNARAWLDLVQPDAALFMVSEYWHNYLGELRRRAIPTFLVSALIRDDAPFFRRFGVNYRRDLTAYTRIFTLDEHSVANLRRLGCERAEQTGDPLFDNAWAIARQPFADAVVERFKGDDPLFVAGSLGTDADLELVAALAAAHTETKMLIVPHEIDEASLRTIEARLGSRTVRWSACTAESDFAGVQCLIVDAMGRLASLYRYGRWAYVGGGFTPYLHSVIEAVVYGLPVAFGPEIRRKVTPAQLMERGIGTKVATVEEFAAWFEALHRDEARLTAVRDAAAAYIAENVGATRTIVGTIAAWLPPSAATTEKN